MPCACLCRHHKHLQHVCAFASKRLCSRFFFPLRIGSSSFTGIKSCIPVGIDKQRKLSRARKWWEQWQTNMLYTERVLKVLLPKHCFGPVTVDSKEPQGCKAMTQRPPNVNTQACGKKRNPQHAPPFKMRSFCSQSDFSCSLLA